MVPRFTNLASALLALTCLVAAPQAFATEAKCQLQTLAELKVLNDQGSPKVTVGINGHDTAMVVDTGSAFTLLLTPAARRLGLSLTDGPQGLKLYGAGGESVVYQTTVSHFEFGGASVPHLTLLVAGARAIGDAAGLLGWDLLSHWDVEFDLPHHVIRLLRPVGCPGDEVVYWSATYHRVAIEPMTSEHRDIDLDVALNHRDVEATLDSGASNSILTPGVAARVGATLTPIAGEQAHGLGAAAAPLFAASLESFAIGGEEIRNARIQAADMFAHNAVDATGSFVPHHLEAEPKMLLGADFLRAHRVLVAPDQNKLYFTYEGGPVFSTPSSTPPDASPPEH